MHEVVSSGFYNDALIEESVIVVGGGIAGLTAGAILAREGLPVKLFESHYQLGGCAGTFTRGKYIFDVGATQVAGFEQGGIHERLFRHLNIPLPSAEILDPACLIDLCDTSEPIRLWHDAKKWEEERIKQFPGSDKFWAICSYLHKANWTFASKDPVLPARNTWDLLQLIKALSPVNLSTLIFSKLTISDLLLLCGCNEDKRLKHFLDMQLQLFSQEPADRTAALYGATVLQMAQKPLGLWHLQGSMQKLSDYLSNAFCRDGGNLFLRHRVTGLTFQQKKQCWTVDVIDHKGDCIQFAARDVVFSLTPQSLLDLMPVGSGLQRNFRKELENLPVPKGAIVFYGALDRALIPENLPNHVQLAAKGLGSLFISISREGDGRAPQSNATLIASIFTEVKNWSSLSSEDYQQKKQIFLQQILHTLEQWLGLEARDWLHKELATPQSFQRWTGRPGGIVGGLGQHPSIFGPFGLASRTPMRGLWFCGDSIYPGEGTAGVSQSALMASRQLLEKRGQIINLRS